MESPYIVVLVTTSSKPEAENIAQQLLEAKLIACANIVGPVSSHFRWEGKEEQAEEFLLLMKSRLDLFEALSAQVRALHSYEVPEVLALPVAAGSKTYLDWIGGSLT
ncbi:MAG: divalent-cation tolerance protein CutA [Candidatus Bathyarchaeota archaeon]|nr:divalent-cation tolerance protein CutA [Candidatus Bathyarchaeota archaeon]